MIQTPEHPVYFPEIREEVDSFDRTIAQFAWLCTKTGTEARVLYGDENHWGYIKGKIYRRAEGCHT